MDFIDLDEKNGYARMLKMMATLEAASGNSAAAQAHGMMAEQYSEGSLKTAAEETRIQVLRRHSGARSGRGGRSLVMR